jgi:2'-5' RNA ligase
MIRAFIAVDIPEEIRAAVEAAQARLKRARLGVKVSWTNIANVHLTLQFLGYVEEQAVAAISAALESLARERMGFDLNICGVGAFPSLSRPRVLWVGCEDVSAGLKAAALAVYEAMRPLGFEPEQRDFSAHLTLGRVREPRSDVALTKALESIKQESFGVMRVRTVHLFQSQLHPQGSIYTKLSSHELKGKPAHADES